MRHTLRLAAVAMALAMGASASVQAMPLAPEPTLSNGAVTLIADGCGPYGHRSHYGYCKQDGYGRGYGGGYGGGYRYGGGPRFYDGPGYGRPRCFVRETYYGPRRICR